MKSAEMDQATLEKFLHEQMPLAKAMGVKVLKAEQAIELGCPLASNHNHLGTAFGGSLNALMVLAAYCRLFQMMKGKGHAVLRRSASEFLAPVNEDLRARCLAPDPEVTREFEDAYKRKGKGRLKLVSEIVLKNGKVAARMTAEFAGRAE